MLCSPGAKKEDNSKPEKGLQVLTRGLASEEQLRVSKAQRIITVPETVHGVGQSVEKWADQVRNLCSDPEGGTTEKGSNTRASLGRRQWDQKSPDCMGWL